MISLRTGLLSVLSSVSLWYLATSANQSSFNLELQQHQHQQEAGLAKDLQVGDSVSRRLVALADLHGDLEHAHNVLRMAGLIDSSNHWIAGHDVLVSTGDIVDRGDDTIELYKMFIRLRKEAKEVGGEVHNMLGNHEVMNALHDWRYVTPGDTASFGGPSARREAMSTSGWIGKLWLEDFNITSSIPLLPPSLLPSSYPLPSASFVHGGITPYYASLGIHHINTLGKSFLLRGLSEKNPTGHLPSGTTSEEMALYGENGPLWYRGYAYESEGAVCEIAEKATKSLGVQHLVMGHTPHFDGFVRRCEDKILLIDTGISRAYGGEQSALVFDTMTKRVESGKWKEEKVLTALYKGRKARILKKFERELTVEE